jgi:hypothetical protein
MAQPHVAADMDYRTRLRGRYFKVADNKWQDDLDRIKSWRETQQRLIHAEPKSARDLAWLELVRALEADVRDLDGALARLGVPFRSGELADVRAPYPEALPLLMEHLKYPHLPNNEEMIIRALSVAYGGAKVFDALREHLSRNRAHMRSENLFAIGNALAIVGNKARAADLETIASDEANRAARNQPLRMLASLQHPSVERIALAFIDQSHAPLVAVEALRRAKIWSAQQKVRLFLEAANGDIRAEARRYMREALGNVRSDRNP